MTEQIEPDEVMGDSSEEAAPDDDGDGPGEEPDDGETPIEEPDVFAHSDPDADGDSLWCIGYF